MGSKPWPTKSYTLYHTNNDLSDCIVFLQFRYYLYYTILLSEKKMTSQNKLYEIKLVLYNKALNIYTECDILDVIKNRCDFLPAKTCWVRYFKCLFSISEIIQA
jgi:hypothetical protein